MQFYSQTLDGIPKEFLSHQAPGPAPEHTCAGAAPTTEDLLFILAVLLFIHNEPFMSEL